MNNANHSNAGANKMSHAIYPVQTPTATITRCEDGWYKVSYKAWKPDSFHLTRNQANAAAGFTGAKK